MPLMNLRLEMARSEEFPQGSSLHGYEFVAPLDSEGKLDAALWRKERDLCTVRRFWAGEDDELGHLIHTQGRQWVFHYDLEGDPNDWHDRADDASLAGVRAELLQALERWMHDTRDPLLQGDIPDRLHPWPVTPTRSGAVPP